MTKPGESPDSDIIIAKDDIAPMSARHRAAIAGAATMTQITANAIQRQILGNLKFGSNTGEGVKDLSDRFSKNPATLLSGLPHRFALQTLTQGLPMYYNRVNNDQSGKPKISNNFTALWMTTIGCFFEVSGLKQTVEDKAKAFGNNEVNYWSKSPRVAMAIIPLVLLRNNVYAEVVFGQKKDDSIAKKLAILSGAAVLTTPVDNGINLLAYESATAKDGTSISEIYRNSWNKFIAAEMKQNPYQQFVQLMRNSSNGAFLRIAAISGAGMLLSPKTGDQLEEAFSGYMGSVNKLWSMFQNNVADRGGVKEEAANATIKPSSHRSLSQENVAQSAKDENHDRNGREGR